MRVREPCLRIAHALPILVRIKAVPMPAEHLVRGPNLRIARVPPVPASVRPVPTHAETHARELWLRIAHAPCLPALEKRVPMDAAAPALERMTASLLYSRPSNAKSGPAPRVPDSVCRIIPRHVHVLPGKSLCAIVLRRWPAAPVPVPTQPAAASTNPSFKD